ncbi:uncharacterized protein LOC134460246 [Engraulis encrasicolus]|uniref:uncharacterized protein LOC134460246 n=1 Tax=Engraulis encrasicolus TaxID=184585 RepID=UPI002FCF30ED
MDIDKLSRDRASKDSKIQRLEKFHLNVDRDQTVSRMPIVIKRQLNIDRDEILEGLSALLGQRVSRSRGGNVTPLPVTALTTTAFGYHPGLALTSPITHRKDFGVYEEEFFDPKYDFDFRDLSDSDSECERGGEPYKRPFGWNRIALRVWGKYYWNDWLGGGKREWRNESVDGEWPVAYHGTTFGGAKGIIQEGFKAGPRAKYGRGVYCTPYINVAERKGYTKTFTSLKSGKTYKIALQSRINPEYRQICDEEKKYWLIPVPEGTSAEEERDIVDNALRPYGILFKKIKD